MLFCEVIINMQDTELLQFIHKTAQMGVESLRDIEPMVRENALYNAISSQIREYRYIAGCANRMLEERGESSPGPGTFSKVSSGVMTAVKMMSDNSSSKIAEMDETVPVTTRIPQKSKYEKYLLFLRANRL